MHLQQMKLQLITVNQDRDKRDIVIHARGDKTTLDCSNKPCFPIPFNVLSRRSWVLLYIETKRF